MVITLMIRAKRAARAQYLAGNIADASNLRLGIPVVVLSSIVGTSIFASLNSSPENGWKVAVGIVSVVSVVLAALQTLLGFAEKAKAHRTAGAKYSSLGRDAQTALLSLQGSTTPEL